MEAGPEFNALIAEYVFGWRKVHGPKTDCDGPCESFYVLVPPTIDDPFPHYPPRGSIKPWYWCHSWSTDIVETMTIEKKIGIMDGHIQLGYVSRLVEILGIPHEKVAGSGYLMKLLQATPEQRCKAALMAVLNIW